MFNHLFDYKKGNRPFNELNSSGVLLPTFKPVLKNNLICCRTGFMWVVKCATSLFNPPGAGGTPQMKGVGMLVGNFELNP